MVKVTVTKKSSSATNPSLLRRTGAKVLRNMPAQTDPLRRAIAKFVRKQRDLEDKRRKALEQKRFRLKAYVNRLAARLEEHEKETHVETQQRVMFYRLENLGI